jgi:hypothetical protein
VFFGCRQAEGYQRLIGLEEGELFFRLERNGRAMFVNASGLKLDIDRPIDGSCFDVRDYFCSAVPPAIYLKWAFQEQCWSSRQINASLIVDDPPLKGRYGFFDFRAVLEQMRRHDFATTIAFIPWNWQRTSSAVTKIFLNNIDRYSLVAHGCDHTANEFGTRSIDVLNQKVKTAKQRMWLHRERTGLAIDPVMVFPQGVFSPEALEVLKLNNFIAAVNSDVNPYARVTPNTELGELWNMSVMKYCTFPIFTRRYMTDGIENFAFDAFLGKPCLVAAHHLDFRDEGRELAAFVGALNSLKCRMRWRGLGDTIRRSYYRRGNRDGMGCAQMFANELIIENCEDAAQSLWVIKKECSPEAVAGVRSNGVESEWGYKDGLLEFRIEVPPRGASEVKVEYVDVLVGSTSGEALGYRVNAWVRRFLSEVRDNYVCTSGFLNRCEIKGRGLLRWRGSSD